MKGKLVYAVITAIGALLAVFDRFFIFSFLFLCFCFYLYYLKKFTIRQVSTLLLVYVFFFSLGVQAESTQKTVLNGGEASFSVHFLDGIKLNGDRLSARAKILPQGEKVMISYRIHSIKEKLLLKEIIYPGTTCQMTGSLSLPGQSRNPNSFDYQNYLQRKNIFWIVEPDRIDQTFCSENNGNIITLLKKFRQEKIQSLAENLNEETAAIFAALLFGDRQLMSPETEASYTKTGTVHLLAISGLHVALLTGMCFYLLLLCGVTREKSELILIIILPIYAVLTGLAPPVNRAVTMLLLFLFARRFQIKLSSLDVISIAFLLLLIPSPYVIYEPGFQLSFAVSFALVLSAGGILNKVQSYFSKMAAVSIVSQLAGIPILLTYFYEISLVSIFANLFFVPLFSFLLLPLILVSFFLYLVFPFAFQILLPFVEKLITFTNMMSSSLAAFPAASMTIGKPSILFLLIYLLTFVLTFINWEKCNHRKQPILYLLPLIPIVLQLASPSFSPYGKVVFLDVGQGDSVFIQLPFNRGRYLIDTGGTISFAKEDWQERRASFEVGKDTVVPYLKSKGIRKIDKLILTHGDMDHIGGAEAVLSELKVDEILFPETLERSEMEHMIMEKARRKKIKTTIVGIGKGWGGGDSKFHVVSPLEKLEDKNEGSVVLYANLGGRSWLFTGDLGSSGEEKLIRKFATLDVDVLKVGHHGSRSSSSAEFLAVISPEIAVISAGDGNRYGHPHNEIIDRLMKNRVRIFRTDQDGAIVYTFRGKSGTFRTTLP